MMSLEEALRENVTPMKTHFSTRVVHINRTTMSFVISSDQAFTLNGISSNNKDHWHQVVIPNPLQTSPLILEIQTMGKVTECDCQGGHHSFSTASILPLKGGYTIDEIVPIVNVQNPDIILDKMHITVKSKLHTPIPDHEFIFQLSVV
jgi:hypothetical protein